MAGLRVGQTTLLRWVLRSIVHILHPIDYYSNQHDCSLPTFKRGVRFSGGTISRICLIPFFFFFLYDLGHAHCSCACSKPNIEVEHRNAITLLWLWQFRQEHWTWTVTATYLSPSRRVAHLNMVCIFNQPGSSSRTVLYLITIFRRVHNLLRYTDSANTPAGL